MGWGGVGVVVVVVVVVVVGGGALLLSESVEMCRPLDSPFSPSPQEHPLVGYSNVKNTPVGYHFFVKISGWGSNSCRREKQNHPRFAIWHHPIWTCIV